MGRATIVEHLEDALYTIDVHRDNPRTAAVEQLYRDEAVKIDSSLATLESEAQTAKNELDAAWTAYESDPSLFNVWLNAVAAYEIAQGEYLTMQLRKQNLDAKANSLQGYTAKRRANAWCSTYTTDLAPGTEVATKEIAYQPHHRILELGIIISPLGEAPVVDDGQIRHIMSMTPAQAFLNYALFPGAATWRKRYGSGSVAEIDYINKKLLVALSFNSASGYPIYPEETYKWLPLDMVECSLSPPDQMISSFMVNDYVLVEYLTGNELGSVIGWAEHPRKCVPTARVFVRMEEVWKAYRYETDDYEWDDSTSTATYSFTIDTFHKPFGSTHEYFLSTGYADVTYTQPGEDYEGTIYTNLPVNYCLKDINGIPHGDGSYIPWGVVDGTYPDINTQDSNVSWNTESFISVAFPPWGETKELENPILITDTDTKQAIAYAMYPEANSGDLFVGRDVNGDFRYFTKETVQEVVLTNGLYLWKLQSFLHCYSSGFIISTTSKRSGFYVDVDVEKQADR